MSLRTLATAAAGTCASVPYSLDLLADAAGDGGQRGHARRASSSFVRT